MPRCVGNSATNSTGRLCRERMRGSEEHNDGSHDQRRPENIGLTHWTALLEVVRRLNFCGFVPSLRTWVAEPKDWDAVFTIRPSPYQERRVSIAYSIRSASTPIPPARFRAVARVGSHLRTSVLPAHSRASLSLRVTYSMDTIRGTATCKVQPSGQAMRLQ
jgi:hypothetical protein